MHPKFVEVENFEQVFEKIAEGAVDGGLVNRLYGAQFERDFTLERSNILVKPSLLHFIVPKGQNGYLIKTVDTQLKRLKNEQGSAYYQALKRWFAPLERRGAPVWLLWVVGALVITMITGWLFALLLKRQVSRKTDKLQNALYALEKSEVHYRRLVDNLPEIIYSFGAKGDSKYYSPRVKDVLGYSPEQLADRPSLWHDSIHPEDLPKVDEAIACLKEGKNFDLKYRIRDIKGRWLWLHDRNIIIKDTEGLVSIEGLATDITDRLRMEEKSRQIDRVATLSNLAAGMAHALNSPLGAILQNKQNISRRLSSGLANNVKAAEESDINLEHLCTYMEKREVFDLLENISTAGAQATEIISGLVNLSEASSAKEECFDLNEAIESAIAVAIVDFDTRYSNLFTEIEITRDFDPNLPKVLGQIIEIREVILAVL